MSKTKMTKFAETEFDFSDEPETAMLQIAGLAIERAFEMAERSGRDGWQMAVAEFDTATHGDEPMLVGVMVADGKLRAGPVLIPVSMVEVFAQRALATLESYKTSTSLGVAEPANKVPA